MNVNCSTLICKNPCFKEYI